MNDDRLLLEMRAWLQEDQVAMPDAEEAGRRVAAMLPTVRQKRQSPWMRVLRRSTKHPSIAETSTYRPTPALAANGHIPAEGRTRSMLSPVQAVTAGALVLAMGAALMVIQPFEQPDVPAPGAEVASGTQAAVTGTVIERESLPGTTTSEAGVSRTEGQQIINRWQASDPRLNGLETVTANWDRYLSTDITVKEIGVGTMTRVLENEDGRWVGTTGIAAEMGLNPGQREVVVMRGEGGYAGLTAFIVMEKESISYSPFVGAIVPGDMPPFPGLPAE